MSVGLWNIFPDEIFEPIVDFPAIHLFAFLYRILDFTHNLKKNRGTTAFDSLFIIFPQFQAKRFEV